MAERVIYRDESYQIIGACFAVYKDKGNGFLEDVYQECLAIEFGEQQIPFAEKPRLALHYRGRELHQHYEPDFVCFDRIVVELKAVKELAGEHRAQVINYLKATGLQLGLLVNFGSLRITLETGQPFQSLLDSCFGGKWTLLSEICGQFFGLERNECPRWAEMGVQIGVRWLSTLGRNGCPDWSETAVHFGLKWVSRLE